jgi:tRNA A-37 threonylcarbamoyl transferase component Bud32
MTEDSIFDFGFTAIDETQFDSVQTVAVHEKTIAALEEKSEKLYKSILPLLENLRKNPEKDYIHWPNRIGKIDEFKEKITKIYNNDK